MTWNYRVMKFEDGVGLVEAYYNADGELGGYTRPLMFGADLDDLQGTVERMDLAVKDAIAVKDEVLSDPGEAKPTSRETALKEALEMATDCYVTVLCNQLDIAPSVAYQFAEVKRWYAMVDEFNREKGTRRNGMVTT